MKKWLSGEKGFLTRALSLLLKVIQGLCVVRYSLKININATASKLFGCLGKTHWIPGFWLKLVSSAYNLLWLLKLFI